ncbi:MAG: glycosyltransferase family 2 protein [Desulfobacca sp.]|uniref:glycosyltransferase family 2 protein n=1 Tax=Desulfobacca sp. TaxID=2067990 RepID=UPI00404B88D1
MQFCLAVPTYWTSPGEAGQSDLFFDHPTPLDTAGTLARCLDSLLPLVSPQVSIVVVAAATSDQLAAPVAAQVGEILAGYPPAVRPRLLAAAELAKLHRFCQSQGHPEFCRLLSLRGYGAIRNLTLVAANLLAAEVLVSLDDDEMVSGPPFLTRLGEDLAVLAREHTLFGLAGLYESPAGELLLPEPEGAWVRFWPKISWLNEAFQELAGPGPALRPTPLALGGNMAIPAALYRFLPFDPALPRGEDTDYVLNARLFGIPFFLDAGLRVVHDPPAKPHPVWQRLRQDLQRFWYTRQKLLAQEPGVVPALVRPLDLLPYPGKFLLADLELRAYRAHTVLAQEYLAAGDVAAAQETLANLAILTTPAADAAVLSTYLAAVAQWQQLQGWLAQPEVRQAALEAVWG